MAREKDGTEFLKLLKVVNALLEGATLDTTAVQNLAKVSDSQARRYRGYIDEAIDSARNDRDGLRLEQPLAGPASHEAVVGASLMSSMAALFERTNYAKGMRETLASVLDRAVKRTTSDEYARKFMFAVRGGDPSIAYRPGLLERTIDAILRQTRIKLDYLPFNGKPLSERVEPLSLLVYDHQLYVVVRDEKGKIRKPRRFSRFRDVEPTKEQFEYPSTTAYDPSRELAEVWGVFIGNETEQQEVLVRFSETYRTYVENHHWHPSQKLVDVKKLHVRFNLRPCLEFEQWILGMGSDIEVLSPPWLRKKIVERIADAAAVYDAPAKRKAAQSKRSKAG